MEVVSDIPKDRPLDEVSFEAEFAELVHKIRNLGMRNLSTLSNLGPFRLIGGMLPILALPDVLQLPGVFYLRPAL